MNKIQLDLQRSFSIIFGNFQPTLKPYNVESIHSKNYMNLYQLLMSLLSFTPQEMIQQVHEIRPFSLWSTMLILIGAAFFEGLSCKTLSGLFQHFQALNSIYGPSAKNHSKIKMSIFIGNISPRVK